MRCMLIVKIASDKILNDRVNEIALNSKYDGYQRGLASMFYELFNKKTGSRANVNKSASSRIIQTSD